MEVPEGLMEANPGLEAIGRAVSSTEYIDRSSPFHRSPHSWLFCEDQLK